MHSCVPRCTARTVDRVSMKPFAASIGHGVLLGGGVGLAAILHFPWMAHQYPYDHFDLLLLDEEFDILVNENISDISRKTYIEAHRS